MSSCCNTLLVGFHPIVGSLASVLSAPGFDPTRSSQACISVLPALGFFRGLVSTIFFSSYFFAFFAFRKIVGFGSQFLLRISMTFPIIRATVYRPGSLAILSHRT
ncbi:MAG TPA: hypothetical protein DDW52_24325 [Planctomycetaceae bacterium]|nr:hypothetical protein [Planctomycetaceae bacterium]